MRSHKLVVVASAAIFIVLLTTGWSADNSATTLQNASATKAPDQKTARAFDCRNANEYRFDVVENPNRKRDADPVTPNDLNIVVGNEAVAKIALPRESEAKNFSLNSVEKTNAGFEIKVDWGDGVYHYEVQFNFKCKANRFYLYQVRKTNFSTTNRDSGNFLDKQESKVIKIEPNLPVEKFVMTNYL